MKANVSDLLGRRVARVTLGEFGAYLPKEHYTERNEGHWMNKANLQTVLMGISSWYGKNESTWYLLYARAAMANAGIQYPVPYSIPDT
ncbi:unnamed protein product [Aspergillus oryzae]|uniref:Unnamed protein product n=2 Tax=Aspergillus oryzae TaxID=5062 RepID=A0AAN4Y7G5_ASPOZ|nr:unnamed protein product [Aspergillus oryzae]GMF89827.1 unnamed protein product [Aspergillus oryzae]GMG24159.1 unnamed protein product [Aspergillus oryzae]GMG52179.1 unnamed protein product [Aspergillus oryzae var. brunneus]